MKNTNEEECGHHGHHHHHHTNNKKILLLAFIVTMAFSVLEVVYGVLSNSLSLLSEGIHMVGDGVSMLIALIAVILSSTHSKFKKAESLGAFINGIGLMIVPVFVIWEAIHRMMSGTRDILSTEMFVVATIGLIVNIIVAFALSKGDKENINVRAAMLHIIADLLSSVSTIMVSLIIMFFNISLIDTIVSIVISLVILFGGVRIIKESFDGLLRKNE
ncbi:cation diffusion facilitator family transporter [Bacillus mexicanus]|uniref:cation diffusion facilitator family transporter n=1 Tax=Bacillus mexicanus TaxID=2834415 RepID=UPI003D1C4B76